MKVNHVLDLLNTIPPVYCRLLARYKRGRRALSSREIAEISGLDRHTVDRLSTKTSWDGVRVDTAVKFALACGVNHMKKRRHVELLKTGKMYHILNATPQQQVYFSKLMKIAFKR